MNQTFHMDPNRPRRQLLLTSGLTLLILAVFAVTHLKNSRIESTTIAALAAMTIIAAVMYWRNYKRAVALSAGHSLELCADSIVSRDGATETRIPYRAIEVLKVRRPRFGRANFVLKITGVPDATYYGYQDIDRLIMALADRLPQDRIKGDAIHA